MDDVRAHAVASAPKIERRIERHYRVRFDESGADCRLPASGYLRYAQDLAWMHSQAAGFSRDWYAGRGLVWLIRAVELELLEEAPYGTTVEATTEVLGFRRVWARRKSEFRRAGEQRLLATATIDWVLLNGRGVPVRVPPEIVGLFGSGAEGAFTPLRIDVPPAPTDASVTRFAVRRSELDPMAHVNNAAYLDYLDEHRAAAGGSEDVVRLPRRYRIEFVLPAKMGMELSAHGWPVDLAWCWRLSDANGVELVRARLETDPATWVGG